VAGALTLYPPFVTQQVDIACPCAKCEEDDEAEWRPWWMSAFRANGNPFGNKFFKCMNPEESPPTPTGYKCTEEKVRNRNAEVQNHPLKWASSKFSRISHVPDASSPTLTQKSKCWYGRVPFMCPSFCDRCKLKWHNPKAGDFLEAGPDSQAEWAVHHIGEDGRTGGFKFKCEIPPFAAENKYTLSDPYACSEHKSSTSKGHEITSMECSTQTLYHADPQVLSCPEECDQCELIPAITEPWANVPEEDILRHAFTSGKQTAQLRCVLNPEWLSTKWGTVEKLIANTDESDPTIRSKWQITGGIKGYSGDSSIPFRFAPKTYDMVNCARNNARKSGMAFNRVVDCWVVEHG